MNILKNIPREPEYMKFGINGEHLTDVWFCPHCDNTVAETYVSEDYMKCCGANNKVKVAPMYKCDQCGQKIKW